MTALLDPGTAAANELKVARQHLERRLDDLDVIAAWRDDLTARLRREHLLFGLVDCMRTDEFDALAEEVAAFKAVCRALLNHIQKEKRHEHHPD